MKRNKLLFSGFGFLILFICFLYTVPVFAANSDLSVKATIEVYSISGEEFLRDTHSIAYSVDDLSLIPKGLRRIFTMNSYEIEFPLKHPKYIMNDVDFQNQLFRVMGTGHPFVSMYRNIEKSFLILKKQGIRSFVNKLKKKMGR